MSADESEVAAGPRRIGRYLITREIGSGATSRVFLAHDSQGGSDVALKLYHDDKVRPDRAHTRRKLFVNEARLAGELEHPNIVRVLDSGEAADDSYIVCEYLRGAEALNAHTQRASLLPQREVVEILFACAKALDYAHRHGVIHRDIKPSNVLLMQDGTPKLIDFGIAVMSFTGTQTVTGLIGSPSYMAPEQVRDGTAIACTDVYSLGVMGYELLSGHRPFYGENLSHLIHQIIYATPQPLSHLRTSVPADLEAVITRAMEKDPQRRFPDALAMAAQLARVLEGFKGDTAAHEQRTHFDFVRHLPLFRDFGYREAWETASRADWRNYAEGEEVIAADSRERALYVVVSGEIVTEREGRPVRRYHHGQSFGELTLSSAHVRMAGARAATASQLMRFDLEQLEAASTSCQLAFHKLINRTLLRRLAVSIGGQQGKDAT
ncbi:MAG: serine/threonine-protein kinase [Gammaproteobacteria bacterium]